MATRPDDIQSVYRIFISFTSRDQTLAEYLASELRRIIDDYNAVFCFSLPGTKDSRAGSRPADDVGKNIDDALKKCNVFILLWSESARRQHWIRYELTRAKHLLVHEVRRMGKEFKIIPKRPLFKSFVSKLSSLRTCRPDIDLSILRLLPRYFPDSNYEYPLDPSYEIDKTTNLPKNPVNEAVFRHFQIYRDARLLQPIGEKHLYYAAMHSKSCRLTSLGCFYWRLVKHNRI